MRKTLSILFFILFIIYLLSSPGRTPFDYFTRLAQAMLDGRFYITENPPWLSELIPAGENKFYIVYPPMPAIVSIPMVFLFKEKYEQQILAHLLGAGIATISALIAFSIRKNKLFAIWTFLSIGIGSIIWYLSSVGSSWYLGQITACFFLILGLYEAIGKKRSFLIGLCIGAAYLSRLHTILSVPFFLYCLHKQLLLNKFKPNFAELFKFFIPILLFILFDVFYNYSRFGVPFNKGYFLIPGTLNEPWFHKGIVHPSYIIEDLKVAFLALPNFFDHFPYIQPSWAGLAIWITTPSFIYALKSPIKENIVKFAWLAILPIFLVVGMHGGTGFAQFGYRFAVDFYPFLILLMLKGMQKNGVEKIHWVFLFVSIIVNLWGVLWINKFGWVSY